MAIRKVVGKPSLKMVKQKVKELSLKISLRESMKNIMIMDN